MPKAQLVLALHAYGGQDAGGLEGLDALIADAVLHPPSQDLDRALFGIFERFPEEDGYGVYWSIVHGLERRGGYEEALLASARRAPSPFGLRMLNRLCNAGQSECAGVSILSVLDEIASSTEVTPEVRREAAEFLEYQRNHSE